MLSSPMRFVVDRVEASTAVVEALNQDLTFNLPVDIFPYKPPEGSVFEAHFKEREDIEQQRREDIANLQDQLIEKPDD
jgi:hypothetical protein